MSNTCLANLCGLQLIVFGLVMAGGAAATCSVAVDHVPMLVKPVWTHVLETDAAAIDAATSAWITAARLCKAQSPFPTWSTTDGTVCQNGKLSPCKINPVKGWDIDTGDKVKGHKVDGKDKEGYDGICDSTGKVCWATLNEAHAPGAYMASLAEICRGQPGDLDCPLPTTVVVTTVAVTTVPTTTVAVVPLPLSFAGTTTVTPYDSSASSGIGDQSAGSHSASLNEGHSLMGSLSSAKSSGSLSSGSSDSTASGSSGFYLPIWQWVFILALCCCCLGGLGGVLSGGKKRAVKKKSKRQVAAPAPAPAPEEAPLMPPLMPAPMTTVFLPPIYA